MIALVMCTVLLFIQGWSCFELPAGGRWRMCEFSSIMFGDLSMTDH